MADTSDVQTALEAIIIAALYPAGAFPAASAAGMPVRVYRGWPVTKALDTDIAAGIVQVSVFPLPTVRNTTRHFIQASATVPGLVTLTAILTGAAITLSGTIAAGQVIGVLSLGIGYAYRLTGTETLASLAAALAVAIPGATASGAVLTLPTTVKTSVAVVADATQLTQYGRVQAEYQITLWCPTPQARDAVAALLVPQLVMLSWLGLPNTESGRLRFVNEITSDKIENAGEFRRDIKLSVEYPVSVAQSLPCFLFGIGQIAVPGDGVIAAFGVDFPLGAIVTDARGNIIIDQAGTVLANPSV